MIVSSIYNEAGLYWTSGFSLVTMLSSLAVVLLTYNAIVPLKFQREEESEETEKSSEWDSSRKDSGVSSDVSNNV